MIKNYLKIAFRNLWRHRVFSFINILGLTVGMTAFFLIFLYVRFELSYDAFNTQADRTYRIVADIKTPTEILNTGGPAWAVGPHLKGEFPEVEASVRISGASLLVRRGEVKFQEDNSLFADSAFFGMFNFPLLKGNPRTALSSRGEGFGHRKRHTGHCQHDNQSDHRASSPASPRWRDGRRRAS